MAPNESIPPNHSNQNNGPAEIVPPPGAENTDVSERERERESLSDYLIQRAVEAYETGDVESFKNASAVYDEIHHVAEPAEAEHDEVIHLSEGQEESASSKDEFGFIIPHDGNQEAVGEEEQEAVAEKFTSFVSDLLLSYADEVSHFEHSSEDSLLLYKDTDDPNVHYTVAVRRKTDEFEGPRDGFDVDDYTREEISVQKIVDNYGRDYFGWRLKADGVVRRWTGGDMSAKSQREKELGIYKAPLPMGASMKEMRQRVEEQLAELRDVTIPNARLEKNMGLNNQPIGMDEFEGLQSFLSSGEMYVPDIHKRII